MAKRFTDTDKWKDEWFTDLDPMMKILWIYICDNCDHAGVWRVNFKLASNTIGGVLLDKQSALRAFVGRVRVLKEDKWFIEKFIPFQYPKGLSASCKAHIGVINLLKLNGIDTNSYLTDRIQLPNSCLTVQDKDKEQDKDSISIGSNTATTVPSITPDEVMNIWNNAYGERFGYCAGIGGGKHRDNILESIGYMKTASRWEELFLKASSSRYLSGQEGSGWTVNFLWLINYDNALKVLSDNFNEAKNLKHLFAGLPND